MYRSWVLRAIQQRGSYTCTGLDFFIKDKETPVGVQVVVVIVIQKEEVHVNARVVLLLDVQIE